MRSFIVLSVSIPRNWEHGAWRSRILNVYRLAYFVANSWSYGSKCVARNFKSFLSRSFCIPVAFSKNRSLNSTGDSTQHHLQINGNLRASKKLISAQAETIRNDTTLSEQMQTADNFEQSSRLSDNGAAEIRHNFVWKLYVFDAMPELRSAQPRESSITCWR